MLVQHEHGLGEVAVQRQRVVHQHAHGRNVILQQHSCVAGFVSSSTHARKQIPSGPYCGVLLCDATSAKCGYPPGGEWPPSSMPVSLAARSACGCTFKMRA